MDSHALIRRFLQQQTITVLDPRADEDGLIKAGIVPFMRGGDYRYYVMKPVASRPELDAPPFQLCKGTRMVRSGGIWRDKSGKKDAGESEALAETAIREGMEELGLIISHIARLFDAGPYDFTSAAGGGKKTMWLFAAEMTSPDMLPPAPTTFDRAWMSLQEFEKTGREDHRPILQDLDNKLRRYFSGGS